ncbi:LysM domain protein [Sarocladium strictum]
MKYTKLGFLAGLAIVNASPVSLWPRTLKHQALSSRDVGFQLMPQAALDSTELSDTCKSVVGQTIQCEDYVGTLGRPEYHGSLEDEDLTDAVCVASCRTALTNAQRRIAGACTATPELSPGYPVSALIESVLNGWNETCLQNEDTDDYCNDIIDSWDEYEEMEDMPEDELCSYCFGAKLRMMQASPYSAYDELYASMLEHVNEVCGVEAPTAPQIPPWSGEDPDPEDQCDGGDVYTTQDGDSCDSIALDKSISSATLYYNNPDLLNCSSIPSGQTLCLPEPCEDIHRVQQDDDCIKLAVDSGTTRLNIIAWNLGLDSRCTNLWSTDPFWGRVICTSQPGGEFVDDGGHSGTPGNGNSGGEGGSGNGYSNTIADLPDGTVAEGSTIYCGHWVQAGSSSGSTCSAMLVSTTSAVPIGLFLEVNPSLKSPSECDGNLEDGNWYCLLPYRYWKELEEAHEEAGESADEDD